MEMKTTSIMQIVSGFQPDVDGMGDFSRRLGASLWSRHSIKSHFVVYRRPEKRLDASLIFPNSISYPPTPTPSSLLTHMRDVKAKCNFDTVLLHYGPYAYSQIGRPKNFIEAIRSLSDVTNLFVYFHELYASAKQPWRRVFWTSREQQASVRHLMAQARACVTSNSEYVSKLERMNTRSIPVLKMPVFSNVGEPQFLKPLALRAQQMVIFGQYGNRARLYLDHRDRLIDICESLGINLIADVGSHGASIPEHLAQISVQRFGRLDDDPLSSLLANSVAGVIGYWPDVWEKSGVMAAYQAHAMIPILIPLEQRRTPAPAFTPYLLAEDINELDPKEGLSNMKMQSFADAAHRYYIEHQSVTCCTDTIAAHIS
jgi:hypothetical protein